jgi:hypothetical protein
MLGRRVGDEECAELVEAEPCEGHDGGGKLDQVLAKVDVTLRAGSSQSQLQLILFHEKSKSMLLHVQLVGKSIVNG